MPTLIREHVAGSGRQVDRWEMVVGAVTEVAVEHVSGDLMIALGCGDFDEVEATDVVVRRGLACDLRGSACRHQISVGQGVEHHDVCCVDDRGTYSLVEAVTVEQPTPAMLAEVVEGQTVNELERIAAEMTGKEASLFVTSGTQGNLLALLSHCERGDEYITGTSAHTYLHEAGGGAVLYAGRSRDEMAAVWVPLGIGTCNEAEYVGLIAGLRLAHSYGVTEVEVVGDSQLLIKQMQGIYQVPAK